MIKLASVLAKRKLEITNCSSTSSRNVNRDEERCIFDGNDLILFNVLSRLPVETLIKLKAVCRRWRYLIKHDKYFINLHLAARSRYENTLLIYPTCRVYGTIPIKRFSFCPRDLRFDDSQGQGSSDTAAVVTSDNVTFNEDQSIRMLEPVNGLVCFVRGGDCQHASVLIYNPSTRAKTPWIETSTSAIFGNHDALNLVQGYQGKRFIICYEHMFGFGIDPTTNQHKVFCIYEIALRCCGDIISRELACGVFTVGENSWRMVDQVPPDIAVKNNCFHVHGSLSSVCWISGEKRQIQDDGTLVIFDLGSETFRIIVVPSFIMTFGRTIHKLAPGRIIPMFDELAEVDGRLAIIVREGDDMLNLWIYNASNANSVADGNWIKETLQMPCCWDGIHNLAFKCITGTSLVVIKFLREQRQRNEFRCEFLQYYDRNEKTYYRNQFSILMEPSCGTYSITPFFGTLLPVQTIQHGQNNIGSKLTGIHCSTSSVEKLLDEQ